MGPAPRAVVTAAPLAAAGALAPGGTYPNGAPGGTYTFAYAPTPLATPPTYTYVACAGGAPAMGARAAS